MEHSNKIVGRVDELKTLTRLYKSPKSEFAVIYGRRRVGKTYLVSRKFESSFTFRATALANAKNGAQLDNFKIYLNQFFPSAKSSDTPKSWLDAFQLLTEYLSNSPDKKKVVFFDELPWFDTYGSDFLMGLEHFWNGWAAYRSDILLITCGSAASWMINNMIRDKGGLHNRVTERILVQPFSLKETEMFLKHNGANYDRYQLLELYMVMGGIPFYLERILPHQSVAQNIDRLFFQEGGILRDEYHDLYRSLFNDYDKHLKIVEVLAKKAHGISRKDLAELSKIASGGTLSKILNELEQSGFIKKYFPFGKNKRNGIYMLSDPYTLFYLRFVQHSKAEGQGAWLTRIGNPKWRAWSGVAYEYICMYHVKSIKAALGIESVYTEVSKWKSQRVKGGAEIDLIFDRNDRVINICEIKFSEFEYNLTNAYVEKLKTKMRVFKSETKTKKALFLTMITTFGIKENAAASQIQNSLDMNALFD